MVGLAWLVIHSLVQIVLTRENYNPHIGLLIDPVLTSSDGLYTCVGRRGSVEKSKMWLVTVTPGNVALFAANQVNRMELYEFVVTQ